ncbi:hypothetical protein HNR21_002091 [Actinomadura cellulosilytica]|uniref:Uncharacterized protein n=1 Tax=Thermomonospora cellulosilytica TaxID=1411118 RepID=A0A7W3R855_9ACTN|nr:hypothetical protein [Thermomonospora cellulosilytica]
MRLADPPMMIPAVTSAMTMRRMDLLWSCDASYGIEILTGCPSERLTGE